MRRLCSPQPSSALCRSSSGGWASPCNRPGGLRPGPLCGFPNCNPPSSPSPPPVLLTLPCSESSAVYQPPHGNSLALKVLVSKQRSGDQGSCLFRMIRTPWPHSHPHPISICHTGKGTLSSKGRHRLLGLVQASKVPKFTLLSWER